MSRLSIVLMTAFAVTGVGYPALAPMPIRLIWNVSASAPIGLYSVDFNGPLEVTDLVAVAPTEPLATFFAARNYLPKGVPLMKRVRAVSGQTVCRSNVLITVDGIEAGTALEHDRAGRTLPTWSGCLRIPADEIFLMNWEVRDSLDGRYFGPISIDRIIGRAIPLWTDEEGDGRFEWRASTR
ncbi:S26 family signal peptidase [Aminobacter aminovorans]|uniref:S26 family signal peptidase n=1 Tax=Aminobacter aminovorans TaxID=83263 RepID=UPI002856F18F|nr:S26 family signal peptidase [Aminobacter aminovorans]MDR7225429.1 conjugative transfer signal peptidase TraF [Aminobacter aminovorans]